MDTDIQKAIQTAAANQEALDAVACLYAGVQHAIDACRPSCQMSGRCCRFEEFGHRLYVTTLELGAFLNELVPDHRKLPVEWDGAGCPHQVNKLCTVHGIRPFGCRIFFCDPTADQWQQEQYERFHAELKRLHERFAIPYYYMEWRQGLRVIDSL